MDNTGVLKQVRQVEMGYQLTVVGLFVGNLESTVTLMCAHPQHSGKKSVYKTACILTRRSVEGKHDGDRFERLRYDSERLRIYSQCCDQ